MSAKNRDLVTSTLKEINKNKIIILSYGTKTHPKLRRVGTVGSLGCNGFKTQACFKILCSYCLLTYLEKDKKNKDPMNHYVSLSRGQAISYMICDLDYCTEENKIIRMLKSKNRKRTANKSGNQKANKQRRKSPD